MTTDMSAAEAIQPTDDERPSAGVAGHPATALFTPRFRGFQTAGGRRHPGRLSHILRSVATGRRRSNATAVAHSVDAAPMWSVSPESASQGQFRTVNRPASATTERRRFLRRLSTHLVRVLPWRDAAVAQDDLEWALHESPYRGRIANISMNGVAFLLRHSLTTSTRVWLKLENRGRDFAVIRSARIVRTLPASESEWTVTCRFDRCIPYADVVQLSQ